jgi:DNA (cytosine-5)-methyltransferase 1
LSELHVIDLFSGIGGFSLGLHQADPRFKTIAFCEIDSFCQKVLKKNFPEVKIYGDIKKTTFTEPAFLVCGGFPCQSISIAGKQRGKDDDRWLFPQMLRVIKQVKPKWILAENVQNLLNIADGEILQGIYNDLEALDYEIQTFRISAASQGAWHKRERVWIVGCLSNSDNDGSYRQKKNATIESSNKQKNGLSIGNDKNVPNSNTGLGIGKNEEIQARWNTSDSSSSNVADSNELGTQVSAQRQLTSIELLGSECEESWWQAVAKICGVPNGIQYELDKDRAKRIKALGNAIVPQIITELGKAIIKAEFNDG